ncbi:nipsnap family containing protein [Xenorhabdus sp. Vera]|uniref:nipsnap family containing protein n=1 Tax=Xenorhabdus koppenhoeferi TaxID=351659 RepID=UPI0019A6FB24|nr:nipsnap family containing protein [Xenorhabdus sp. Vera]MBD2812171.1 nipsnap family containing protein [Xenorhabdus sp. Vera]
MDEILTEFYKSSNWTTGPRADIIERISKSTKLIIELPVMSIDALRGSNHSEKSRFFLACD